MCDAEFFQIIVADLYPCFVFIRVQRGLNNETGLRSCARDEIQDDLVGRKWSASPVLGNATEQPMLNLVPLAGSRWKMTDFVTVQPNSVAPCVSPAMAFNSFHGTTGYGHP